MVYLVDDIRFELDAAATVHNSSILAPPTNSLQPSSASGFLSNFELLGKDSVKKFVLIIPFHLTREEICTAQAFLWRAPMGK